MPWSARRGDYSYDVTCDVSQMAGTGHLTTGDRESRDISQDIRACCHFHTPDMLTHWPTQPDDGVTAPVQSKLSNSWSVVTLRSLTTDGDKYRSLRSLLQMLHIAPSTRVYDRQREAVWPSLHQAVISSFHFTLFGFLIVRNFNSLLTFLPLLLHPVLKRVNSGLEEFSK